MPEAIIGIVAAIVGAFIGAYLQKRWTPDYSTQLAALQQQVAQFQQRIETLESERNEQEALARFRPTCEIVGAPPDKQHIHVTSPEAIQMERIDYRLADDTLVASESVALEGTTLDVLIRDEHVLEVQNMPQPEKSSWDASAPIRFRLHFRVRNHEKTQDVRAWIRTTVIGSTFYRKIVG